MVERFGRFPHRNAILGRRSTPEELEFLQTEPRSRELQRLSGARAVAGFDIFAQRLAGQVIVQRRPQIHHAR